MRDPLRNIEDFIREKLGFLEHPESNDWAVFERKLKRALFFKRLKVLGGFTAMALCLLALNQFSPSHRLPYLQDLSEPSAQLDWGKPTGWEAINVPPLAKKDLRELGTKESGQAFLVGPASLKKPVSPIAQLPIKKYQPDGFAIKTPLFTEAPKPLALKTTAIQLQGKLSLKMSLDRKLKEQRLKKEATARKYEPYISPLQQANPWSYAINVYPNFTFRKFKVIPDRQALLHSDFVDEMASNEKSGFSLNIGLEASRRIGAVTYLKSGVEYITNAYQADFDFVNFRDAVIDPENGEILSYLMRDQPEDIIFNAQNSYHYLNLPLSISYQPWANKHLRLNLEAGGSLLHFLGAEGRTLDYKSLAVIDLGERSYRKFLGSFSMKIGMQYWVNPKVNIGFEPTLMYFTNTIYTEEYPFYVIPYSVGLNFNLQVKLN